LVRALLSLPASRNVNILDSCGVREPDARFLIAGLDPVEIADVRPGGIDVRWRDRPGTQHADVPVLEFLDARLRHYRVSRDNAVPSLPAYGACIAVFAYDLAYGLERLRLTKSRTAGSEPIATLAFYDSLVIHDYATAATYLTSVSGAERLESLNDSLMEALDAASVRANRVSDADQPERGGVAVASNFSPETYIAAIERVKDHIAAGDIYQANLTQQFTVDLRAGLTPEEVFLRLRRDHPASFAAFLRRSEDVVVSASPERFFSVDERVGERVVEAWPVKGTSPRGRDKAEDARLRQALLNSEKDRAENIMIVDLLRNDLGRVCRYGSIEAPELFRIQEHPTLFHLVSKVRGVLREDVSAGQLLRATFPCGSITGAPKIRAMEIIDAIEPDRRGVSMGAIGYLSFDGRMDLNVAIRTMTIRHDRARFNTGGGIVADSDAGLEYAESMTKARALLRALGCEAAAHAR
jgi:para-aminobenzoate synthetase component 1